MPGTMLTLGPFAFQIDTAAYDRLRRLDNYRWETMARGLLEPVQQWLGIGTKEIELTGVIYPALPLTGGVTTALTGPDTQWIDRMRVVAALGEAQPMADGRGYYYGMWCILSVEEGASLFMDHGGPRKQDFRMRLIRQGEGEGGGATAGGGAAA